MLSRLSSSRRIASLWPNALLHGVRSLTSGKPDSTTRLLPGRGSHVVGDKSEPLLNLTVDDAFSAAVSRNPTGAALVCPDQHISWTYSDLDAKVEVAARGLSRRLGVRKGDRVGCWLPNVYEYIVLQYATARLGAILVTLNPAYRLSELRHALNLAGVSTLVMMPRLATSDYVSMVRELAASPETVPDLRHIVVIPGDGDGEDEESAVRSLDTPIASGYSTTCENAADAALEGAACDAELDVHDIINIQFTSGTTGLPKAVALSHHSIVNNGRSIGSAQRLGCDDRVCIPVPLYHCFGLVLGSLACISASAAIVLPCRSGFSPARTLAAVASERCTALYGVPTMFIAELALPDLPDYDVSSLRTGIMAGSLCPPEVMQRVHRELGMTQVTIAYGMTETSPVSWQSQAEGTPFEKLVHTVGRVLPHVECKVVDSGTGATVPIGQRGELLTRGYLVMHSYWGDPEATAAAIDPHGGWMRTGDLVSVDIDGYCSVVGRSKDLIIRGGENIAPKEVEDACYACEELVQDVQVVGVPDERFGEQVCACVVLRPGRQPGEAAAEELRAFCREKISHFKVPKYVHFVEDFPMTVTGKVQKHVLVSKATVALGL